LHKDDKKLVWDFPTRAFHWLLALSLVGSWITAEAGFEWTEIHFLLGYFSLGLVLFRLIWGFVGTTYARFSQFVKSPVRVFSYLPMLFSRRPPTDLGHNPIGGWSVLLMLTLVGIQAGTGLFISDDIFYAGPYNAVVSSDLAGRLASIHHTNFLILQITVALHLGAVCWYTMVKKTNLIGPMITGKKVVSGAAESITSSRVGVALIILVVVAAAVTALVQLAPPPSMDDYMF
jgi:cytochrome b